MLHHSFEHMSNPHQTLEILKSHLNPHGVILLRIPIVNTFAWNHYKENWFQIDAPRHSFIYSIESIKYLAEARGLYIDNIIFDSTGNQFVYSERYKQGVSIKDQSVSFSRKERKTFRERAKELNNTQMGDQACFFLKRKDE